MSFNLSDTLLQISFILTLQFYNNDNADLVNTSRMLVSKFAHPRRVPNEDKWRKRQSEKGRERETDRGRDVTKDTAKETEGRQGERVRTVARVREKRARKREGEAGWRWPQTRRPAAETGEGAQEGRTRRRAPRRWRTAYIWPIRSQRPNRTVRA